MLHTFKKPTPLSEVLGELTKVIYAIKRYPSGRDITLLPHSEVDREALSHFFELHNIPCTYITDNYWSVARDTAALKRHEDER